jgi:L-ascorbate 6-phosphate lactonase
MVTPRPLHHAGLDARSMSSPSPEVTARRLGQAGFDVTSGTTRLVIDPFLSDYPGRLLPAGTIPEELAQADAILVTHEHEDHLDLPALAAMPPSATVVIVPAPLVATVRAALPGRAVVAARVNESMTVGDATVIPIPALHGLRAKDGYGFHADGEGEHPYVGYVVRLAGTTLFHAGDGLDYPDLATTLKRLGVTLALLPINGRDADREALDIVGNMDAQEAVDLVVRAGVRCVIPMHYDMFANNPGSVGHFVGLVTDAAPHVNVLVPGLDSPIPLPSDYSAGITP